MSTPTLYDINVTLMNLIFEREDIESDPDLTPKEIEQQLKAKDVEIREHVTALVKKVDGVAYVLRELEAHAATAKAEKERQRDREHAFEARRERLETLVKSVMLMSGKARLDGDANTLRLVKCPPSVEIAQPELLPAEYRQVKVPMSEAMWNRLVNVLFEHDRELWQAFANRGQPNLQDFEPMKTPIKEALKQTEPCVRCDSTGIVTIPLELRIPEDNFKGHEKCVQCKGTGKVSKGVPGCRMRDDKMSLRVE